MFRDVTQVIRMCPTRHVDGLLESFMLFLFDFLMFFEFQCTPPERACSGGVNWFRGAELGISLSHTIPLKLLNKLNTLYVQLSPLISLHNSLSGVFNVKCMILQVLYEASLYLFSPIMHFLEAIPSRRRSAEWDGIYCTEFKTF